MANNSDNLGISSRPELPIQTLNEIQSTSPQLPTPTFISYTMIPEVGPGEWGEWARRVANEAPGGVGIMDLNSRGRSDLGFFDVEEATKVSKGGGGATI